NLANPGRSGGVCGRDSACRPLAAGWSNVTNLLWGNEAVETIRVMHFCAWERLAGAYRESDGEPVRDEREAGRQVEFPEHAASGRLFHGLKAVVAVAIAGRDVLLGWMEPTPKPRGSGRPRVLPSQGE